MEKVPQNKLGETDIEYFECFCTAIAEFSLMDLGLFNAPKQTNDYNANTFIDLHKFIYKDVFEFDTIIEESTINKIECSIDDLRKIPTNITNSSSVKIIAKSIANLWKEHPFTYGRSYSIIAFIYLIMDRKNIKFDLNRINRVNGTFESFIHSYCTGNAKPLLDMVSKAIGIEKCNEIL